MPCKLKFPAIVAITAFATLANARMAQAADAMQATYGATVQTTLKNGPTGIFRFNADRTFTGVMTVGPTAVPFAGTFTTNGETLCVTMTAPAGWAGKPHCTAFGVHAVGNSWIDADGDAHAIVAGR